MLQQKQNDKLNRLQMLPQPPAAHLRVLRPHIYKGSQMQTENKGTNKQTNRQTNKHDT